MQGLHAVRGWRNLPLVREHDVPKTRRMLAWMGGVLVSLTPFVFYLWQQIDYVHVRYRIEELRAQHARLLEAERRLCMERATLEALPRVEAWAKQEGLQNSGADAAVVVRRVPSTGQVRAPDRPLSVAR